jgi:A/G-specific adenine glycosylase
MAGNFARQILDWYQNNARSLPWRETKDPYAILVSEVMLQQTRVETVIPYYQRWMERFPTVPSLASATEDEVLRVWEGLGYYSRARNLHKAVQMILEHYAGMMPGSSAELQKLPGVGVYTAAAVASIAFGEDVITVDANVRRVAARLFDLEEPSGTPILEEKVQEAIQSNLPAGLAGDYNQALMELGACVCVPHKPACQMCPLKAFCLAYQKGVQEERPVKKIKKEIPHYEVTAAVIWQKGQVLLAKRPATGLLAGMWEFLGGKLQPGESHAQGLMREIQEELGAIIEVREQIGVYHHAYTHYKVTLYAFHCKLNGRQPEALEAQEIRWVEPEMLDQYPMGKIDRLISRDILKMNDQAG